MLIANMTMSDLLYPTFLFPVLLAKMHVGSWLIGGTLGQSLCKLNTEQSARKTCSGMNNNYLN